jgi:hypothetical protein
MALGLMACDLLVRSLLKVEQGDDHAHGLRIGSGALCAPASASESFYDFLDIHIAGEIVNATNYDAASVTGAVSTTPRTQSASTFVCGSIAPVTTKTPTTV